MAAAEKKKRTPKKSRKGAAPKGDGRSKRGKYTEWLTEDGLGKLEAWRRNGLTKEEVAHNIGCSLSTLKDWEKKYPAISAALSRGREEADMIVENSLFKTANGYTVRLAKTIKLRKTEFNEETGRKVREEEYLADGFEEMHVPANERAQEFWLKNRKPEVWRDKPAEIEGTGGEVWEVRFDVDEEAENGENSADAAAPEC